MFTNIKMSGLKYEGHVKVVFAIDNDFDKHFYVDVKAGTREDIIKQAGEEGKKYAKNNGIEYDHLRVEIVKIEAIIE